MASAVCCNKYMQDLEPCNVDNMEKKFLSSEKWNGHCSIGNEIERDKIHDVVTWNDLQTICLLICCPWSTVAYVPYTEIHFVYH